MDQEENYFPTRNAASRPPRREGSEPSGRTVPDYTEIPLSSVGRIGGRENSAPRGTVYGRPAAADANYASYNRNNPYGAYSDPNYGKYAYPPARQTPGNGTAQPRRTAPNYGASPANPYASPSRQTPDYRPTPPSKPAPDYGAPPANPYTAPNRTVRPATQFTEITWDSLQQGGAPAQPRSGRSPYDQPVQQPGYAAPPQQAADPYGIPRRNARPYPPARPAENPYNMPQQSGEPYSPPRQSSDLYGNVRRSTNPYAPAEPKEPEQPKPAFRGGDLNRPAAPRTAARFAAGTDRSRLSANGAAPRRDGMAPRQTPAKAQPAGDGENPPRKPGTPRPKNKGINPLFLVVALIVVVLVIVVAAKFLGNDSSSGQNAPARPQTVTETTPEPGTAAEQTAQPEETPAPTPVPTPEPTPTPSGPKAQKNADGLVVSADWGVAVPERKNAVYDSHFDKSCMIGNSLVEGFFMWSGLTNCKYIYNTGAVVNNVLGVLDLAPITLNPGYYEDIYLLFGLNEVGTSAESFATAYIKVLDFIREYQPQANIYIISVTPVTAEVDADPNEVQSMERINNFNSALKQMCLDYDCWYLDIYSMLLDENGFLSADYAYAGDGKHFEKSGYVAWANYMKIHYVDEALITE